MGKMKSFVANFGLNGKKLSETRLYLSSEDGNIMFLRSFGDSNCKQGFIPWTASTSWSLQ